MLINLSINYIYRASVYFLNFIFHIPYFHIFSTFLLVHESHMFTFIYLFFQLFSPLFLQRACVKLLI